MTSLTILYSDSHLGHVMIVRQVSAFLQSGYSVTVLDQAKRHDGRDALPYAHIRIPRIEFGFAVKNLWRIVRRLGFRGMISAFWMFVLAWRYYANASLMALRAIISGGDIYIAEDLMSALALTIVARVRRRPIVYDAHELESEQGDPKEQSRRLFLRSLERRTIPKVDVLIAPNEARANLYEERYPLRNPPIVVENCPPLQIPRKSNLLHNILDLQVNTQIALYHGSLIPYRSLDRLVECGRYLNEGIVLAIIGAQGSYYREVLRPIQEAHALQESVRFVPEVPQSRVLDYVASSDLGIVIYEAVNLNNLLCAPTKLYEFIMMKVPVAASEFPVLERFLYEHPIGALFDPSDPRSIAESINDFFAKSEVELLGVERALEIARQRFTWETESEKWARILESLTEDKFSQDPYPLAN